MALPVGRGAQVRLDGEQRRLARGAGAPTLAASLEAKRLLEHAGAVSTGYAPDGASPLGVPPEDEVLVPFGETPPEAGASPAELAALAARVTALEAELARLRAAMDDLHRLYGP